MDKKTTAKAQKVLGFDKSNQKLIDILGIDISEVSAAQQVGE